MSYIPVSMAPSRLQLQILEQGSAKIYVQNLTAAADSHHRFSAFHPLVQQRHLKLIPLRIRLNAVIKRSGPIPLRSHVRSAGEQQSVAYLYDFFRAFFTHNKRNSSRQRNRVSIVLCKHELSWFKPLRCYIIRGCSQRNQRLRVQQFLSLLYTKTGNGMPIAQILRFRFLLEAPVTGVNTSWRKTAARFRLDWGSNFSL